MLVACLGREPGGEALHFPPTSFSKLPKAVWIIVQGPLCSSILRQTAQLNQSCELLAVNQCCVQLHSRLSGSKLNWLCSTRDGNVNPHSSPMKVYSELYSRHARSRSLQEFAKRGSTSIVRRRTLLTVSNSVVPAYSFGSNEE